MAMLSQGGSGQPEQPIAAMVAGMRERLDRLPARLSHQRVFLSTYQRTTQAVGDAIDSASFEDPGWVERWTSSLPTCTGSEMSILGEEDGYGVAFGSFSEPFG